MAFLTSETWKKYFENRDTKILMLGLDDAGKTTILKQLKLSDHIRIESIIGFNPEIFEYKGFKLIAWDYMGNDRIRDFWRRCYFPGTNGIIYVIDSSALSRLEQSIEELNEILKLEETKESVFLIFLNKQDQEGAIDSNEFQKQLNFELFGSRPFKIQTTIATAGEGLYEGLNWFGENINKKIKQ